MSNEQDPDGWARLRFAIIGPLLAAPPAHGELCQALEELAIRTWKHPTQGTAIRFSVATLERWYYPARKSKDPVAALRPRRRRDAGRSRRLSAALIQAIEAQYRQYPGWTVKLHYDNLVALAQENEALGPVPSYGTIRRHFKTQGYFRKRPPKRDTEGARQAEQRLQQCEVRSY